MNLTLFKLSFLDFGPSWRKLSGLLLCFLLAQAVSAQIFINNQNVSYTVPGTPPPQINATAFDNENTFSVSYDSFIANVVQYCEPWWGTLFYTNNSQLTVNNLGVLGANDQLTTFGFEFDLQQTNSNTTNILADTFYNPGIIHCVSALDGNISPGVCLIQATNVIVPGTIAVGGAGTLVVNGQNVNLDRSVLSMESALISFTTSGSIVELQSAPFTGTGVSGLFTNAWDPSVSLTFTTAQSPLFPSAPNVQTEFFLPNSLPYNQQTGPTLNRSAFVENDSPPNVIYNVYFGFGQTNDIPGQGDLTIEWVGTYVNFATGQLVTNYLYLNDDYVAGAVTNVPLVPQGWPRNFVLTQSATRLANPANAFPVSLPVFDPGVITNKPFVFATFTGNGTGLTNAGVLNPSGSITNLPGQVLINATKELSLNFAQITDPQYMSLTATNQFDGSAGAEIDPLFSDMNLASTNGSLTISNLIEPQIPDWNGTIQAWGTRWFDTVSNFVIGMTNINGTNTTVTNVIVLTNDWRTVLVDANLNPFTPPQIRNLTLGATNSLVIGDQLNVFGSMFASAQNLTLTTNTIGTGASSPDGELNLQNIAPTTWTWPGSFPNLLWVTNSGAIRLPNLAQFIGNSSTNLITTNMPATLAMATISSGRGTNVLKNNTVTIGLGGTPYVFTNSITSKSPAYAVLIGRNFEATMTNLMAAINFTAGSNKVYSTNSTFKNGFVTAGTLTTNVTPGVSTNYSFTVSAIPAYSGTNGNIIPVGTTATNLFWNPANLLAGGSNAVPGMTNVVAFQVPYGAIINNALLTDQGSLIWVTNFQSGGVISSGNGSFKLTSITTTLTNGLLQAGGDIILAGTSLTTSNLTLQAGRSLVFNETNLLTDLNQSNANFWTVGSANGGSGNGLVMPIKPAQGDLLATTIGMVAPAPNKIITSTWAGTDFGFSTSGYNNNVAIGQLALDAQGPNSAFYFTGIGTPGVTNAIYVDRLILLDYASYANGVGTKNIPTLLFNTNLVIYYADAVASSTVLGGPLQEVSFQLNGSNTNRLRWVPEFMGMFSSTNFSSMAGTDRVNIGLLESPLDSRFFVPSEVNFAASSVMPGQKTVTLTWDSIPSSTNTIYYSTNLISWTVITNFVSPTNVPPVGGWPITNVLYESINSSADGFYRVSVGPNPANVGGQ
jgi:hypothetical protein